MADPKQLRIVFLGTPDFAVTSLKRLSEEGYNIVGVITAPDKPSGRGLHISESAVKKYASLRGIPVLQPVKLKDPDFVEQFRALEADLGIVIAFRMLPEIIWSMPHMGTFNLHASLLPDYRGAAPINHALMNGEKETGVTTFFLRHEIDTGDILMQQRVAIGNDDTAGTMHDKLMVVGSDLVIETVNRIAGGNYSATPQQVSGNSTKFAPKIFKDSCRIDWNRPATEIRNFIRGLSPYPGAWTSLVPENSNSSNDAEPAKEVKIFNVEFIIDSLNAVPGHIESDGKTFIHIGTGEGRLSVEELQMSGKKRMTTEEFLRGFKNIQLYNFV